MSLIPDILRAVADGLDQAAGRDPVDKAADEAREVVNGQPALFPWCSCDECRAEEGRRLSDGDPADTAKVGDDLGMDWLYEQPGSGCCPVFTKGDVGQPFGCTRSEHHPGQHVATGLGRVLAVWPQEADPDVVELTGPVPDEETGIQLGLARQELRRFQKMYGRASETIGELRGCLAIRGEHVRMLREQTEASVRIAQRLEAKLAEKPYRIDTGERVLHVRPGEGVLVEAQNMDGAVATRLREKFEDRFPGVRWGVFTSLGQIQIITAAEQTVVDTARAAAELFAGDRAELLTPGSQLAKLVDAVHALDRAGEDR